MKTPHFSIVPLILLLFLYSCDRNGSDDKIVHQTVNKEFVIIQDVNQLQNSNDAVSQHIDSILSGLITTQIISTGVQSFDFNGDKVPEISFEIVDLNQFNGGNLPDYLDSLAARAIPGTVEILDNSTYSYPDALLPDMAINETGNWSSNTCVLGTFMNAGQFQGKGNRFLGFRIKSDEGYQYGWVQLYCSQHNDTLRIIDYAYNDIAGSEILSGQTD